MSNGKEEKGSSGPEISMGVAEEKPKASEDIGEMKYEEYLCKLETAAKGGMLDVEYNKEKQNLDHIGKHYAKTEEIRLKTQASRQALERAYLEIKAKYGETANRSKGKSAAGHGKDSSLTKICPKCGKEYNPETKFCEEDGTKLIEIWKCRHCGEDLTKAQGYSAIKVCTNCGKSLDAMQQKSINSTKRVTKNPLKRICTNEKCGASYENNAKFCGNCGSPIVSMQCSCGEIFRQKEDGSFDKHCPVCGKPNPVEKKKNTRKIGEIIELGSWRYEADGTKRPIKWQIMEIADDGTAVLLSCYAIDNHAYHSKRVDITWAESDIRKWLNGEFYNNAFSEKEKERIIKTRLENKNGKGEIDQTYIDWADKWGYSWYKDNKGKKWDTPGGAETEDNVWLLSLEDIKKYSHIFKNDKDRQLKPTPNMCTRYEYGQGEYFQKNNCVGNAWWWLRSPGNSQFSASYVYTDGFVNPYGFAVDYDHGAVRAALKINLKNL